MKLRSIRNGGKRKGLKLKIVSEIVGFMCKKPFIYWQSHGATVRERRLTLTAGSLAGSTGMNVDSGTGQKVSGRGDGLGGW